MGTREDIRWRELTIGEDLGTFFAQSPFFTPWLWLEANYTPYPEPYGNDVTGYVALMEVIVTPATVSPPCFDERRLGRARVVLSLTYVVGITDPETARKEVVSNFEVEFFFQVYEVIFFPREGREARVRRATYSEVITDTTPLAPE